MTSSMRITWCFKSLPSNEWEGLKSSWRQSSKEIKTGLSTRIRFRVRLPSTTIQSKRSPETDLFKNDGNLVPGARVTPIQRNGNHWIRVMQVLGPRLK